MEILREEDLKRVPALRWFVDPQDQAVFAKPINKRYQNARLYFWGEGLLAICDRCDTKRGWTQRLNFWMTTVPAQASRCILGDTEGLIVFDGHAMWIPKMFFRCRRNRVGNVESLKLEEVSV